MKCIKFAGSTPSGAPQRLEGERMSCESEEPRSEAELDNNVPAQVEAKQDVWPPGRSEVLIFARRHADTIREREFVSA
jgi:hypothetical protein